jgi:hypothetical protein
VLLQTSQGALIARGRLSPSRSVHSKYWDGVTTRVEIAGDFAAKMKNEHLPREMRLHCLIPAAGILLLGLSLSVGLQAGEKTLWKPVAFAIVKFNGGAPKSWNMYHSEKKGLLLVHLWKRYLLLNMKDQEVYELDPQTVKPHGEEVEWSDSDAPDQPLEISEWKERNVGRLLRVSFRLGKDGHILELQIPLKPDGKPLY